jgi:flagellar motility protein MotE (MotC chaperone)
VKNIRLLPVVVLAISALLVLKTMGLVTNGGYVLSGASAVQAASAPKPAADAGAGEAAALSDPTISDTSPTLTDASPTLPTFAAPAEAATTEQGQGIADGAPLVVASPADGMAQTHSTGHLTDEFCIESHATITESGEAIIRTTSQLESLEHLPPAVRQAAETAGLAAATGQTAVPCLPSGDVVPARLGPGGMPVALTNADGSPAQQVLNDRVAARRAELAKYEEDLALRASLVDAAEKRIEERKQTLEALESQIGSLVDQRTEMESGQFAGIVAMYSVMKPKDAAKIFNNLDMAVLLRVAKEMTPRKMAPILAEMDPTRAQDLTVQMAAMADKPATDMTQDDLAALPQIIGN